MEEVGLQGTPCVTPWSWAALVLIMIGLSGQLLGMYSPASLPHPQIKPKP